MKQTYLVTGSSGFIGSYLVKHLLNETNAHIIAADLKNAGNLGTNLVDKSRISFLEIDLTDNDQVLKLPEVDYIFHLAAINGTSNFYKKSWHTFFNSSQSTINLINRYKESKSLKRFVYTSTSEVYASMSDAGLAKIPTPEDTPVGFVDLRNPRWSYGGAKLLGELALYAASNQFPFDFSIIRYHNVYGPRMGYDHVIPDFIDRARRGFFELYGAENMRSFIYIDDAIEATFKIAFSEAAKREIVHVGTEEMLTMRDLAKKLMILANWEGTIEEHPAPNGSVLARCPDNRFLKEKVGFEPKISLERGLKLTLDGYLGARTEE